MLSPHSFLPGLLALFAVFVGVPPDLWAQGNVSGNKPGNNSNLIRPEYYTALEILADGQTAQAVAIFEAALAKARVVGDQRGIDSIPALVMSAECFREQCDIAMALERYDGALMISLMGSRWPNLLKSPPGNVRADTKPRDIQWAANLRSNQYGVYTEAWPISLGSPDTLLELAANPGVEGKTVSIDALEILRCQALALRRRFLLLGPLAKHSPLAKPLLDTFRTKANVQSEVVVCSLNICRALAELGVGERTEAIKLLKQNLSLSNGLDHPLTAVALLTLADLAIDANEMGEAYERSIEASIVAARAGQVDHLAESVEYLAATGYAAGYEANVAKVLPQIIAWAGAKGRSVGVRGQVEWAKLLAFQGNSVGCKEHTVAATTLLLPKQIVLPRAEAAVRYARARTEFLEGKLGDGVNSLVEGLAFLRGAASGQGVASVFQLFMAQQLIQSKALSDAAAEEVLVGLLKSPSSGYWRAHPLEQLAWMAADKSEAIQLLLGVQTHTRSDAEVVEWLDESVRNRFRQSSALESRVFDLQLAIHGDNRFIKNSDLQLFSQLRKQIPALEQNAVKLKETISSLVTAPKWDIRKWSPDDTRRWETALSLSETQQAMLWATAVSPAVIPEAFPPRHTQEALTSSLQPTDGVVYFGFIGEELRGYLFQAGKWSSWNIGSSEAVQKEANALIEELMGLKRVGGSISDLKKNWSIKKRQQFRNRLFPKEVWAQLLKSDRWIIVPDRFLWYIPFDILPVSDQSTSLPTISEHKILTIPTLGLVPFLLANKKLPQNAIVDIHMQDFFCKDSARAKEIRDELASSGKHIVVDASIKNHQFPQSRFFKLATQQICAYFPISRDSIALVPIDNVQNQLTIQSWGRLPWGTPPSIVALGINAVPPLPDSSGDEFLRMTLPCIAQGTRHLLISRWCVGGESTATLMRSLIDNQQDMSSSEAWQRSVVSLWEEQFDPKKEPLFQEGNANTGDSTISGSHPLLWSGYMNIGE